MLYRPTLPRILWDGWLFNRDGKIHQFYLEALDRENFFYLGHKISTDMARWQEAPSIQGTGFKGRWNEKTTLTDYCKTRAISILAVKSTLLRQRVLA